MNFLEILISEKLKDADQALDITGSDRKVLQVACQDFTNYLKYHWNLIGKEASQCELVEKIEKLFKEDPDELEQFLTVWISMWFKKWKFTKSGQFFIRSAILFSTSIFPPSQDHGGPRQ